MQLFPSGYTFVSYIIQGCYDFISSIAGSLELKGFILIGVPRGWYARHSTLAFRPFILEGPKWYGLDYIFSNKLEKTKLCLDYKS